MGIEKTIRRAKAFRFKELGILIALVLLVLFFGLSSEYFFQIANLINVLRQISVLGIMSIGMTMVIVSGEIDLSVGSVYGLSACITGVLMQQGAPILLAVIIGLLGGLSVGLINGVLTTYGKIPSIITTLGMLNLVRGLALILVKGQPLFVGERYVADKNLPIFFFFGQGKLYGVLPITVVYLLIFAVIGYIIFNKTIFGFHAKAVGGNAAAARASGISVYRTKIFAFALNGLLCGFAGIIDLAFLSNIQGTAGIGLELSVIAAVIIGGTTLGGGSGTIIGSIIGVLIIGVLRNGLVLLGVSPFIQISLIGAVIIGAVGIDMWTRRKNI